MWYGIIYVVQTFVFQGLPCSSRDAACCCQGENHSIEQHGLGSAEKQKYGFCHLSNTEVLATDML